MRASRPSTGSLRPTRTSALRRAVAIRKAVAHRSQPPCLSQRSAHRELHPRRRSRPADRLGVRRHGRPLVRPRQLRGEQRAGGRARGATAHDLLRRGAGRAPARRSSCSASCRTCVRRCGASFQSAISELDFDFSNCATKHFDRLTAIAADPLRHPGCGKPSVGPAQELPGAARCVVIGGGVGGTSIAYHLTKLGWDDVVLVRARPAHLGLDVPLGRPRRSAARLCVADADDDVLGRALPRGAGRRLRLDRVRQHPAGVERGAHGGAPPAGRLGEDLRPAAGAHLGRSGASASR